MDGRLSRGDWIAHGLSTLADRGAKALRVVPMAAALNVSRGSFYWHFRDIADFRAQILQRWREVTTERVIDVLEEEADAARDRFRLLMQGAFVDRIRADPLPWVAEERIRAWAQEDEAVAAAVAAVDERRITYIERLLEASGVAAAKARPRATFLYWAYLGRAMVMDPAHASADKQAINDIVRLFEA